VEVNFTLAEKKTLMDNLFPTHQIIGPDGIRAAVWMNKN
jgi:hypothetical protein